MDNPTSVIPAVVEAAPVLTPTPTPTPTTVETVTPAPVVETVEVKPAETVIGQALDKAVTPVAPVVENKDTPVVAEVKQTDGGQSAEPAPPPKYEAFVVPEGLTLDNERVGKFTELLSGLELEGKANHDAVQQFGQKAVDFHISEVKQAVENVTKFYQTSWEKQKTDWKDATLKDPELGGNRIETTVNSALEFIRTHGGTAEQQKEFRDLMETSGLGNNPVILRLLSNAGKAMSEGRQLAASKPVQQTQSKVKTLYSKSL